MNFDTHGNVGDLKLKSKNLVHMYKISSKTLKYEYWMTLDDTVQVLHNNYIMIINQ